MIFTYVGQETISCEATQCGTLLGIEVTVSDRGLDIFVTRTGHSKHPTPIPTSILAASALVHSSFVYYGLVLF